MNDVANPWLYYPALITSPIWCAFLAAGFVKAFDRVAHEWFGGKR